MTRFGGKVKALFPGAAKPFSSPEQCFIKAVRSQPDKESTVLGGLVALVDLGLWSVKL